MNSVRLEFVEIRFKPGNSGPNSIEFEVEIRIRFQPNLELEFGSKFVQIRSKFGLLFLPKTQKNFASELATAIKSTFLEMINLSS